MRSISANQRELSRGEYNAYKYSSKIYFENFGLSKSPKFEHKQKEKYKSKIKVEAKKYSDLIKSKESYSKANNLNINININHINNIKNNLVNSYANNAKYNNNNIYNCNLGEYSNNILFNENINQNQYGKLNEDCKANKSPEKIIQVSKYSDKLKSSSSIKNLSASASVTKNLPNNHSLSYNNNKLCDKASSNKLIDSNLTVNNSNQNSNTNNINTNLLINNSTNYSNSNFASKNMQINNSTNNMQCNANQNSMLNTSGKKYNQDEIRYKLKKLFEYYCQFGERLNTSCLKSNKFIKFSSEADILDEQITKTRLELIFSSENKTKSKAQIDFECFLNCLIKVAEFKYTNEYKGPNKCLQALIDDKILPLYEKVFNSNNNNNYNNSSNINNNFNENDSDIYFQNKNQVSNFCSDTLRANSSANIYNNINHSNSIPTKISMRKGSDIIFDPKTSMDLMDQNIFTSSFAICSSVKNVKSKNFFNKIDDIQEVVNSHNNSVLGSESNINDNVPNNSINKIEENLAANEKDCLTNNIDNSPNLNWKLNNINDDFSNIKTNCLEDGNNANINDNLNINNISGNIDSNKNQGNISSIIFQNPNKKNLHFEENFQKSQLEEILVNASLMLFEIYKVYFPWELSLANDENFMKENSQKNYFLLLKEFDIWPNIISKSSAYQIWKEQVEDKLEKINFDNSNNNTRINNKLTDLNYLDRINENIIYYNVIKNIETTAFSSSITRKNSTNGIKEKKNLGKYFSFVKFLKCLCLIADNGIEKYCNIENEMDNLENIGNGDLGFGMSSIKKSFKLSSSNNLYANLNASSCNNLINNSDLNNLNSKLGNMNLNLNNQKNITSSKTFKRTISLNSNQNVKSSNYSYEYNLAEKVFLLLEKMEFSSGFLNIQHKTSKTNSYKSSFIISRDLSDKIKTNIENKINEIKKENNNFLEKRDDYENLQRQKKLRLSIKNNFKNIFEHGNYIIDRYGAKLSDLFKNYCCFGDPLNTTWMKSNKFSKLLKDADLLILNNNIGNNNVYSGNDNFANVTNLNLNNFNVKKLNTKNSINVNIEKQGKEKEQRGILVNDIDVIFIKLSSANSLSIGNNNMNTSVYGSNLRDLSMNTYISLGTIANRNSLNMTRSSFSASLSPNKIQTYKKSVYSITNSAKIDFNGFVNAIEIISLNIFPEKNEFEAIDIIVTKHLLSLLKNFNHKNKYSDKYSILFQEKSNNFEYVIFIFLFI